MPCSPNNALDLIRRCITSQRRARKVLVFLARLHSKARPATDRFGEIYNQILSVQAVGLAEIRVLDYGIQVSELTVTIDQSQARDTSSQKGEKV